MVPTERREKNCPISQEHRTKYFTRCELDITNCVPDQVDKYEGTNPNISGPNCWNLALVMKGILPALRYSTPGEMAFYMNSPLCRPLQPWEKRNPGDIGAIRYVGGKEAQEIHGFIYISDKIAYSKNGFAKQQPYALQSLANVYNAYGVDNKIECRANQVSYENKCTYAASYFRCSSMESYLNSHRDLPDKLIHAINSLGGFESCLQADSLDGIALRPELRKNIIDATKILTSYLKEQLKKHNEKDKNDFAEQEFLLGALQLRIQAITWQLGYAKDSSYTDEFQTLSKMVGDAELELKQKAK